MKYLLLLTNLLFFVSPGYSSSLIQEYVTTIDGFRSSSDNSADGNQRDSIRSFSVSRGQANDRMVDQMEVLYYSGQFSKSYEIAKKIKTKSLSTNEYIKFLYLRHRLHVSLGMKRKISRNLLRVSRETKYFHFLASRDEFLDIKKILGQKYKSQFEKIALKLISDYPFTDSSMESFKFLTDKYTKQVIPYRVIAKLARIGTRFPEVKVWVKRAVDEGRVDYGRRLDRTRSRRIRTLLRLKEYDQVISEMSPKLEKKGNTQTKSNMILAKTKALLAKGDTQTALETASEGLTSLGRSRYTLSLWKYYASLLSKIGKFDLASQEQTRIYEVNRSRYTGWRSFWFAYRSGDLDLAEKIVSKRRFRALDRKHPAMKTYWKSKVLWDQGNKQKALVLDRSILERWGDSYYATLVMKRHLRPQDHRTIFSSGDKIIPISESITYPSFDVRRWFGSQSLLVGPRLKSLEKQFSNIRDNTLYWETKYPRPYYNSVADAAKYWGFDPLLTYSFMRAESFYNTHAKSHVGARGLMQIMPYTGHNISREISDSSFRPTDLFNPDISIYYGSFYISKLLNYYKGNLFQAVAAYNAERLKVDEWKTRCELCPDDVFVDSIPFRETRRYVKKVLKNYTLYKRIYESKLIPDLFMSEGLAANPSKKVY